MKTDGALPVWREFKWCTRDWLVCNMQMQIYPWGIATTKCLTIMLFSLEVISYYGFLPLPSSRASFLSELVLVLYPLSTVLKQMDWQLKKGLSHLVMCLRIIKLFKYLFLGPLRSSSPSSLCYKRHVRILCSLDAGQLVCGVNSDQQWQCNPQVIRKHHVLFSTIVSR